MLLNWLCYSPTARDWPGHSVVGYGYQDDLFEVCVPTPTDDLYLTVSGFAIMDT